MHVSNDIGLVESGQKYRLRFKARSNRNDAPVQVFLRQLGAPYSALTNTVELATDIASQTFDIALEASDTHDESIVMFALDDRTETIWLDDVSLTKINDDPPGESIIENGTFDENTSPWYHWSRNGSSQVFHSDGELRVLHYDTTADAIAQLIHDIGQVDSTDTYTLTFDVRSNKDNAPVSIYLQQLTAPWLQISELASVYADLESKTVEVSIDANQSFANSVLILKLDARTETIWIDNVSLTK